MLIEREKQRRKCRLTLYFSGIVVFRTTFILIQHFRFLATFTLKNLLLGVNDKLLSYSLGLIITAKVYQALSYSLDISYNSDMRVKSSVSVFPFFPIPLRFLALDKF